MMKIILTGFGREIDNGFLGGFGCQQRGELLLVDMGRIQKTVHGISFEIRAVTVC